MHSERKFSYRSDIDGLRAIAVVAVILYHFIPSAMPGGFVGVDMFFVISGYVICGSVAEQLRQGRFSFADFYKKRILRLMPALAVVSISSLVAAYRMMTPYDFLYFTTSLATTWSFCSNLFFSLLSGSYFDPRFELFPLLHTWSLSVEEQFYIVFPALLIVATRLNSKTSIFLLFLLASCTSSWLMRNQPNHYYLLSARAFELLSGALLVGLPKHGLIVNRAVATICAWAGAAMVSWSLLSLSSVSGYPGLWSLLPTAGTALLIAGSPHSAVLATGLRHRWVVGIGLVSYSLYLWHWPVLAFLRYRAVEIDACVGILAIASIGVLSFTTWYWIERPIRASHPTLTQALVILYVAPAFAAAALAGISYFTRGVPQRFDADQRVLIESYSDERDLSRACSRRDGESPELDLDQLRRSCAIGSSSPERSPSVLLFGDSHANHFKPLVDAFAREASLAGVYTVSGSCAPVVPAAARPSASCVLRNKSVEAIFGRFQYVVIAGQWDPRLTLADFSKLIEAIEASGARPVVLKDSPAGATDMSRCALKRSMGWIPESERCEIPIAEVRARSESVDRTIDALKNQHPSLIVFDPKPFLCNEMACATLLGGLAVYRDQNHINARASALIAERAVQANRNPFARP